MPIYRWIPTWISDPPPPADFEELNVTIRRCVRDAMETDGREVDWRPLRIRKRTASYVAYLSDEPFAILHIASPYMFSLSKKVRREIWIETLTGDKFMQRPRILWGALDPDFVSRTGFAGVLQAYSKGTHPSETMLQEHLWQPFCETLLSMHSIRSSIWGDDIEHSPSHAALHSALVNSVEYSMTKSKSPLLKLSKKEKRCLMSAVKKSVSVLPKTYSLLHRDLHHENILVNDNKIEFLDFGRAMMAPRGLDIEEALITLKPKNMNDNEALDVYFNKNQDVIDMYNKIERPFCRLAMLLRAASRRRMPPEKIKEWISSALHQATEINDK